MKRPIFLKKNGILIFQKFKSAKTDFILFSVNKNSHITKTKNFL